MRECYCTNHICIIFSTPIAGTSNSKSNKNNMSSFKHQIDSVLKMSTNDRNIMLCKLATKKYLDTIKPHEIIQLSIIQQLRTVNGEIDNVLKSWADNPDLDPRIDHTI